MRLLALLLLAVPAAAAEKKVAVVFTGDNLGELVPCGCMGNPSGGLARRKTVLDAMKGEPVLVLDAGNALNRAQGAADAPRTRLTFELMARLGTRAMAVGPRDLAEGVDALRALSAGSSMKLLSANLARDGKRVFDSGAVFPVGGVKVGVFALTAPGRYGDVDATELKAAAKEALATLGPRDVTVLLAAIPYEDALVLARELPQVDFMIQSGNERGTVAPQRVDEKPPVVFSSAQRGQALGRLEVRVGAKKPFVDLAEADRVKDQLKTVDGYLSFVRGNSKDVQELKARRTKLQRELSEMESPRTSTFRFTWQVLNSAYAEDAEWRSEVLKVEPPRAK